MKKKLVVLCLLFCLLFSVFAVCAMAQETAPVEAKSDSVGDPRWNFVVNLVVRGSLLVGLIGLAGVGGLLIVIPARNDL